MKEQPKALRELSLFTGAGGGLLASHLLGWEPRGYVEIEDYNQRVLAQRIKDGHLPEAPIFTDIRAFLSEGYARSYQGMVDIVTGGFPCQFTSTAARGRNNAENLWPIMRQVIETVQPKYVFAENVSREAIKDAARSLGCATRIGKISAACLGAPHRRTRWWLVANTHKKGESRFSKHDQVASLQGLSQMELWTNDPYPMGVDDGLAHRMDRLKALGNGQVPIVAATAWKLLSEGW